MGFGGGSGSKGSGGSAKGVPGGCTGTDSSPGGLGGPSGSGGPGAPGGPGGGLLGEGKLYSGVVKSFSTERNSGFIACAEITDLTGQDVYVFKDVLQRGYAGVGD